jgi:hypothetical protein
MTLLSHFLFDLAQIFASSRIGHRRRGPPRESGNCWAKSVTRIEVSIDPSGLPQKIFQDKKSRSYITPHTNYRAHPRSN